ncbi:hypothetical protein CTAYLR_007793 [Chrysophaeum taylorii]|uniref:Fe2OG dioxygenase domain-containing protein n=1 Tax=Chrysophaeum taylorii TaxID=2483200 RepID=A0AAD7UJ49_9STRA|nr:hypothetical protein CTAYLR_007793 [Chrysophaeum taylorii]
MAMTMMTTTTNGNRLVASCDRYYRVAHRVVFVRAAPSLDAAKVGQRTQGETVEASRTLGEWVETRGGWMLTEGRAAGVDGALLVPISQREHEERLVRDEAEREHARRAIDALVESTLAARPDLDPNLARREVVRRYVAAEIAKAHHAVARQMRGDEATERSDRADRLVERCLPDLEARGLAVVDGFDFGYPASAARAEAQGLAGRLEETIQKIAGTRDDRVAWFSRDNFFAADANALAAVLDVQRGLAAALNARGWRETLTNPPAAMLSCYPPGGRYRKHRDNTRVDAKTTSNARALTAIFYATDHDWDDHFDGGHLRFYFGDDDDDDDKSRRRQNVVVDVAPRPGRFVLFDAFHFHEVLPPIRRNRFALTFWIFADR